MECVAITRNGRGEVWRFASDQAARLHPVVQTCDLIITSADHLAACYGRYDGQELAELLPASGRAEVLLSYGRWAERDSPQRRREAGESARRAWPVLVGRAKKPPTEPEALLGVIVEDRRATEGVVLRTGRGLAPQQQKEISVSTLR